MTLSLENYLSAVRRFHESVSELAAKLEEVNNARDQALKAMAVKRPGTAAELLAIPGIGIGTVEKYGALIYRLVHGM